MKNITAIDIETALISYENPVPEPVCLSHAGEELGNSVGLVGEQFGDKFGAFLEKGNCIVGHNIAFDLSVLCHYYPELWGPVFRAYDESRIYDTMIRERLLNLTEHGNFDIGFYGGRPVKLSGYHLSDLETKYLGMDRTGEKENEDSWRFRYIELKDTPVDRWPKEAYDYSLGDSVNCRDIYNKQEEERQRLINERQLDPFTVENFRARVAFALRLLECKGERVDPERIKEVDKMYRDMYTEPEMVDVLVKAGLLVLGEPPKPYARGVREHTEECIHHKEHPEYKAGRKIKCDCPPKMKKATDDSMPTKELHKYIWSLAFQTDGVIQAWPSEKCEVAARMLDGKKFSQDYIEETQGVMPSGVTLCCNEEWTTTFADKDEVLAKWADRKALRKIVTDYLPKLFHNDEPAEELHCSFYPLKLTGRSSSKASDCYPSRNAQNVDPRVRPCTIPRDGNVLVSTDYSGMELATLAQKCYSLFGHSVLRNKINNGDDTHAYLASQIAINMDKGFAGVLLRNDYDIENPDHVFAAFSKSKKSDMVCEKTVPMTCASFVEQYNADHDEPLDRPVTWDDFFKYYRKLAKPTGLGFPGGLGPATMVTYAKGTYKVDLTEELATKLRDIWLKTYPEMEQYLVWVKNHCRDPHHKAHYEKENGQRKLKSYYCYDTPLGMHRARCGFCEAANGAALQAFAAEGALDGLYEVQKAMVLAKESEYLYGCYPINFIHDEILWECPEDEDIDQRIAYVDSIMVESMRKITPDVEARTESAVMRRWYKEAELVTNDNGIIIPWEPEE